MMITVWHSTEGRSMAIHTSQAPVEKKGDYGHQPNQTMVHQPTNATFSRTMIPTRNVCYHLEQGNLINFYFMFTIDSGFSNETHLWVNLLLESNGFSLTLFVRDCKTLPDQQLWVNCYQIGSKPFTIVAKPTSWPVTHPGFALQQIITQLLYTLWLCVTQFLTRDGGKYFDSLLENLDSFRKHVVSIQWYQYFNNVSTMVSFFPLNNNGIWFHFLFPAEKVSGLVQNFWIHSHRIFVRMNIYVK